MIESESANRAAWEEHYKRDKSIQRYPDENLVRILPTTIAISEKSDKNEASSALDLGCGSGRHIRLLFEKGYEEVHATDYSSESLALCKKIYSHAIYHSIAPTKDHIWELHPNITTKLDVIVAWGVLHYNTDEMIQAILKFSKKFIKPNGFFIGSLRAASDTHYEKQSDLSGTSIQKFSAGETNDLLSRHFSKVEIGYMERSPINDLESRVAHYFFRCSN